MLRESIPGIVGVIRRGAVLIGGLRFAIEQIVGVRRHLILAIRHRRDVAVVVVRVGFGLEQRIRLRDAFWMAAQRS